MMDISEDKILSHNRSMPKKILVFKMINQREALASTINRETGEAIIALFREGKKHEDIGEEVLKPLGGCFDGCSKKMLKSAVTTYLTQAMDPTERESISQEHIKYFWKQRMNALSEKEKKRRGDLWGKWALKKVVNDARKQWVIWVDQEIISAHYQQKSRLGIEAKGFTLYSEEEKRKIVEMLYSGDLQFIQQDWKHKEKPNYDCMVQVLNEVFHAGEAVRNHENLQKWISKHRQALKQLWIELNS